MKKRGRLLVIEGLEGAGKTTALLYLKTLLEEKGIAVITTREPGGTQVGEAVRQVLKQADPNEPLNFKTELLLFYAARVQLLETVIQPALQRGIWVLSDRCELSSFAYQGYGRGIGSQILEHLSDFCVGDNQPDLLFYMDISPEIGLQRAKMRGTLDRIEQEPLTFFQTVHRGYQTALKRFSSVVCIDAAQPLSLVQAALKQALEHYCESTYEHA